MNKPRVAVIGVGYLGSIHARIYKELSACSLVAVCDTDPAKLNLASKSLRVPGISNYEELFDKVDAVSIATPTNTHYEVASDFLMHNVHTLVEKPFTKTWKKLIH